MLKNRRADCDLYAPEEYNFSLNDKTNADDRVFVRDGVKLVVDRISLHFVKGATVDYVEELLRSAFQPRKFVILMNLKNWKMERYRRCIILYWSELLIILIRWCIKLVD